MNLTPFPARKAGYRPQPEQCIVSGCSPAPVGLGENGVRVPFSKF